MAERMLCISYDVSLLRTRKMLLEDAGCEVVTAEGFALAIAVCSAEGGRLDLIILCHSIAREGSNKLISHVRAGSRSRPGIASRNATSSSRRGSFHRQPRPE